MIQLHLGDCLDIFPTLEAGSIDAIVTDPPYCSGGFSEAQRTRANGQGLRSETIKRDGWFIGDNMGTAGLTWLLRIIAFESFRIVKPTGSLLVFCDWRMLSTLQPAIESAGLRYQALIVWDKGSMGLGTGFRSQHELVMHFTYGSPVYHNQSLGNVLKCGRQTEREHQTQKPEELLAALCSVVCPKGGTLFDPFMGSGTTGVVAVQNGMSFIGAERDTENYAIAEKRINDAEPMNRPLFKARNQTPLFASTE